MRLQWRRFKGAAILSVLVGIVGIAMLVFGVIAGGATGVLFMVLGAVALAGAAFDFYRMYGY